jgi:transcriptional regulator with XRE-family HTH domain
MTEARPRSVRLHFAQRLKELRAARGFRTARSLAQALAIDENRYTRYERAEVEPDLALLMRICDTLGVTPNDLLAGGAPASAETPLAGFAENAGVGGLGAARSPPGAAGRAGPRTRSRALAWQLAGEVAKLRAKPDAPLTNLQIKSRLFADIERDPFAFISRLADDPALAALDRHDQARLAALIDDLIATASSAHLA